MLTAALDRLGRARWSTTPGLGVALARTLVAGSGLVTLAANRPETLLAPTGWDASGPFCSGVTRLSLWCVVPTPTPLWAWLAAIVVLAVAASGWRPRCTALPIWWVLFSDQASMTTVDGGDQVAAVLALLLVPLALLDGRRWHWRGALALGAGWRLEVAGWTLLVLRIQVGFIYLQACLAKLGVAEWLDGTAISYWMRHPSFGPPEPLHAVTDVLFRSGLAVTAVSWGTLVLEFFLGVSLLITPRVRPALLVAGVGLHLGIAVTMGLWSFAIVMWGALVVLLVPDALPQSTKRNITLVFLARGRARDHA